MGSRVATQGSYWNLSKSNHQSQRQLPSPIYNNAISRTLTLVQEWTCSPGSLINCDLVQGPFGSWSWVGVGVWLLWSKPVMSKYHKMDPNEYPNIFWCHIIKQTNIQIVVDAKYLPNKYLNIFLSCKWQKYE